MLDDGIGKFVYAKFIGALRRQKLFYERPQKEWRA